MNVPIVWQMPGWYRGVGARCTSFATEFCTRKKFLRTILLVHLYEFLIFDYCLLKLGMLQVDWPHTQSVVNQLQKERRQKSIYEPRFTCFCLPCYFVDFLPDAFISMISTLYYIIIIAMQQLTML